MLPDRALPVLKVAYELLGLPPPFPPPPPPRAHARPPLCPLLAQQRVTRKPVSDCRGSLLQEHLGNVALEGIMAGFSIARPGKCCCVKAA